MLAVHWSPVKHTKAIVRNGIRKSRRGLFCFPLTGHHTVDRWWAQAFRNWWRPRTPYNGFVFRIQKQDLPARFGPLLLDRPFDSLQDLESEVRRSIVWRIGHDRFWRSDEFEIEMGEWITVGEQVIREDPQLFARYQSDPGFIKSVFVDCQIILSRSITPKRIIRVLHGSQFSGRTRLRKVRYGSWRAADCR